MSVRERLVNLGKESNSIYVQDFFESGEYEHFFNSMSEDALASLVDLVKEGQGDMLLYAILDYRDLEDERALTMVRESVIV